MNVFELFAKLKLDTGDYESGLDKAKESASKLGSGIASAVKVGAKAIGVATGAVTAMGGASVKVGMEFDKSMSQVAATMGKTVDEIDELRDFAQEMGRTTAFSATQAADALNYMALAGYDAETSMGMLPNILNLAAAGNMDLARASDMVTDAATAMGMTLEDGSVDIERVTQMVDEMAKAASTGNTSVEQLGDAFLVVGGLAQELNGGFVTLDDGTRQAVDGVQELEIALTAMANAGIKGSEAGTHMRNMITKLSSPTSDGAKRLQAMGVAIFDTAGQMRSMQDIFTDLNKSLGSMTQEAKIQTITDLFNARDLSSAEALLSAVGQDWNAIGYEIVNAKDAGETMAKTQLDNLAGDVTLFKSALEGAQIAVSDKLAPTLRQFVQFGTEGLSQLTDAFAKGGLDAMMDAFGKLLSDGLTMITSELPKITKAGVTLLSALGQGLLDNIDVILDAGIEIIGILGDALVKGAPKVLDAGLQIFETLLSAFGDNLDGIASMASELITGLAKAIGEHAPKIATIALDIIKSLASGIANNLPALIKSFDENIDGIVLLAGSIISTLSEAFLDNLPVLLDAGVGLIESFLDALDQRADTFAIIIDIAQSVIMTLIKGLTKAIPKLAKVVPDIISSITALITFELPLIMQSALEIIQAIMQGITENLPILIDAAISIITSLVDMLIENLPTLITTAIQILQAIMQGITENLPVLLTAVIGVLNYLISAITNNLPMLITAAINLLNGLLGFIVANLPTILEAALEIVQALVKGLVDNIPVLLEGTIQLVNSLFEFIIQNLPTILEAGVKIVLALINGLMEALPDLVAYLPTLITTVIETLVENFPLILEAGKDILKTLLEGLAELLPKIVQIGADVIDKLHDGITDGFGKIKEAALKVWEQISGTFDAQVEKAKNWGKDLIENFISGITKAWNNLKESVSNVAGTIKDFLGFSEPKEGPLSNFHTYAPDMMHLFMQGIEDNEDDLQDTLGRAFDFEDIVKSPTLNAHVEGDSFDGSGRGGNTYTINVNQPVSTPADMLREIRTEAQYGLIIGEALA